MEEDENQPGTSSLPPSTKQRRSLRRIEASDFIGLAELVEEGLDASEDELFDFSGSELGDPSYEPSNHSSDTDEGNIGVSLPVVVPVPVQHTDPGEGAVQAQPNGDLRGSGDSGATSQAMRAPARYDGNQCQWGKIGTFSAIFPFEDYSLPSVINVEVNDPQPIDTYSHFIPDDLWKHMVTETNRYADQFKLSNVEKPNSRSLDWVETNVEEMKRFVGIIILMGLVPLHSIDKYWANDDLYGVKLIKDTMPRDRFLLLKKFWHFGDNEANDPTDRLAKIAYLVDRLNRVFAESVTPGRDLVIDETMIPWRGRLYFRQYNPSKSHKYGVKVYKMCTTEGYTLKVIIYTGKSTKKSTAGHAFDVVMELVDGDIKFIEQGRHVYADNFYTGIPLAEALIDRKTHLCGTIRSNRKGMPKDMSAELQKGEAIGVECQHGTKIVKWKDKRSVMMITTLQDRDEKLVNSGKINRNNEPVLKPQCVLDYNSAKKGVDLSDQMSSYYCCLRKSLKWYCKVALELITGTAMINSWIVYEALKGNRMPLVKYREAVARSLICIQEINSTPNRKRAHSLQKMDGQARKVCRRCTVCYKNSRRCSSVKEAAKVTKQVTTFCEDCPDTPFMCLDCFNNVHK